MPAFGISRAVVPSAGVPKTGMTFRARDRYEMCPALLRDSATQITHTAVAHAPVGGHGTCRTIGRCLKPSAYVSAKPCSDRNGDQGNKANIVATQHGTPWRPFFSCYLLSDGSHGQVRSYHSQLTNACVLVSFLSGHVCIDTLGMLRLCTPLSQLNVTANSRGTISSLGILVTLNVMSSSDDTCS
jgi:hypothetical protein